MPRKLVSKSDKNNGGSYKDNWALQQNFSHKPVNLAPLQKIENCKSNVS